jgi:D-glycero-D-manno-heptose 1,7-bisphosphate phosphatase
MSDALRPALLLDRDGVINVDRGYVCRRADFEWQAGIFDVARTARRLGLDIVVVTNQSGIGRGYYTEDDFHTLTAFMRARFDEEGAPLTAIYHCPFHPEAIEPRWRAPDHPWRKPRPGMILAARDELRLDLKRSVLIGDRLVDLQAGAAAGVGTLALVRPADLAASGLPAYRWFPSLEPVPLWLEGVVGGGAARPALRQTAGVR